MKHLFIGLAMLVLAGCATGSFPTPEQLSTEKFADCPPDYQDVIKNQLGRKLIDPESARYRFAPPQKYVYQGKFGRIIGVGVNAKNRFGGYVGEVEMHFMCFQTGIRQINEFATGFASGLRSY